MGRINTAQFADIQEKESSIFMSKLNLSFKLGTGAVILSLASVFATDPASLQAQETDSNTTIEEIEEDNADATGKQVTVRGEVNEVEPGISFQISEEGFLEGSEVLVVNVSGEMLPEMPDEDLELQVTGELNQFVYADVDRLYDLDLDPDLYVDYENKPVIFAESMTLSPGIEDISERPDNFYSKEVALEGEVGEIKSDSAFTLSEDELIGDNDMLMINVTGEPIPQQEQKVVVTGTVRPYVSAEFERDYDLTWDLDVQKEIEAEYSQKPVLVVDSIEPAKDEGLFE